MKKKNPIVWWGLGLFGFLVLVRIGAAQNSPPKREVIRVGDRPISKMAPEVALLDGVTDPNQIRSYESAISTLMLHCVERPESVVQMSIQMTEYDKNLGYKLTHLDMLRGFGDRTELINGKPRECSKVYKEYVGEVK